MVRIFLFLFLLSGMASSLSAETLDGKLALISVEEPLGFQRQAAIVWTTTGSKETYSRQLSLENGTHVYEMRGTHGWTGELSKIRLVTSSSVQANLELVQPTLERERDIVIRNQTWLPQLVNHVPEIYVGGGYTLHLLSTLLLVGIVLVSHFVLKLTWLRSCGLALLITMVLIEIRFSVDRWTLARQITAKEDSVYLYDEIAQFQRQAADDVAGNSWTMIEVDRFRKYGLFYQFAESPYVTELKDVAFVVSTKALPAEPTEKVGNISLYRVKNQ